MDRTTPQAAEQTEDDRVIVTGSFIAGAAVDTALPVEVYSQEDLEEQGAPTALEFAKSLSIAGPTTGEAYYFSGAALTGSVSYNLRGLGADKTLTLLNGRRMSENTSNIPSAALARTEILKDGAAVIYGADATGGVVNFITRDHFTGLEAKAQYKYIDGSDGDYGISLLGGIGEGQTNFLWSAEWEHRSRLETEERDWAMASLDYSVNPAPWSTLTNLAGWLPRGTLPANPDNTANGEFGNPTAGIVSDFTQSSCQAVGGVYINSYTCAYNYIPYYNLVEENDIYRLYAQFNSAITDNMDLHVEASYGQVMSPQVFGSPAQPVIRGPARSSGATYQFYVPVTNPYAAAFLASSSLTAGQMAATQGLTPVTYRAFAHGGNPNFGEGNGYGVPSKIDNQIWRVSAGINGTLGDWAGAFENVGYDFAATYNQSITYSDAADIIGYRLQEALNGFGGPNCNAQDLDPNRFGTQNAAAAGQNGCQWWNPFSSAWSSQPELGLANPNYVAGTENSEELTRWIYDQRAQENLSHNLTLDLVFNGETPIVLPGGNVGLAVGTQWRQTETRETTFGDFYNGSQPCDWPDGTTTYTASGPTEQNPLATTDPYYTGCTPDEPGPYVFFGTDPADSTDQQQYSYFAEFSIPVLDRLNLQAAVRREDFSGGLGATVYKVSGKWDVWGPLSIRASYGTNYQAPPAGLVPGDITNGVNSFTRAGGLWLGAQTFTRDDINPETATAQNLGVIWQSQGFAPDHDLRIIVDYFDIETQDELGLLASSNQIADVVFRFLSNGTEVIQADGSATGVAASNNGTMLADCSHPLISRVSFNGGACVQGVTRASDLNSIRTDYGNGPGQHTAGFDFQVNYDLPLGPGDLGLAVTATNTTKFEFGPTLLDGFTVSAGDDRLGYLNFATIANAASEWRANASANYRLANHNFRLAANYVSGVEDERGCVTPTGLTTETCYGVYGEDWLSFDFHYNFDVTETLRLSASVVNIADQDPPASRQELGYDPRIGSPLGRTIEIAVKKIF